MLKQYNAGLIVMDGQSKEHLQNPYTVKRKSKPRPENELLRYATTKRGAYRLKRAFRAAKRRSL